jgi:hypothetical protein
MDFKHELQTKIQKKKDLKLDVNHASKARCLVTTR